MFHSLGDNVIDMHEGLRGVNAWLLGLGGEGHLQESSCAVLPVCVPTAPSRPDTGHTPEFCTPGSSVACLLSVPSGTVDV